MVPMMADRIKSEMSATNAVHAATAMSRDSVGSPVRASTQSTGANTSSKITDLGTRTSCDEFLDGSHNVRCAGGLGNDGHARPFLEHGRGRVRRIKDKWNIPTGQRPADTRAIIGAQLDIDNGGRDLRLPDQPESIAHVCASDHARTGTPKRFANIEGDQRLILDDEDGMARKNSVIFPHGRSPSSLQG